MQKQIDDLDRKLTGHMEKCSEQFGRIETQIEELEKDIAGVLSGQGDNTARITEVLEEVKGLIESFNKVNQETAGIRQVWQDLQGTIRIGSAVRKFLLWLVGLPVIGTGLYNMIMYVIQHFKG
jgi:chromosome segregation ATPase